MEKIIQHFDKYLPLDDKEKDALISRLTERKVKRNQSILQEGNICKYFTYVVEGCFKTYGVDKSGAEHNLVFTAEDDWITDIDSLHKEKPSKLFIDNLNPLSYFKYLKATYGIYTPTTLSLIEIFA